MRVPALLAAAALLLASGCGDAARDAAPSVSVTDAWVRLPAVKGRPGAGYFAIEAKGRADRLVAVSSPAAERIELHDSKMTGGMMTMDAIERADIPAGATLEFAPGAKHAMLFGLAADAAPGGTIPLTFTFETAAPVTVAAHMVAAGDEEPAH